MSYVTQLIKHIYCIFAHTLKRPPHEEVLLSTPLILRGRNDARKRDDFLSVSLPIMSV